MILEETPTRSPFVGESRTLFDITRRAGNYNIAHIVASTARQRHDMFYMMLAPLDSLLAIIATTLLSLILHLNIFGGVNARSVELACASSMSSCPIDFKSSFRGIIAPLPCMKNLRVLRISRSCLCTNLFTIALISLCRRESPLLSILALSHPHLFRVLPMKDNAPRIPTVSTNRIQSIARDGTTLKELLCSRLFLPTFVATHHLWSSLWLCGTFLSISCLLTSLTVSVQTTRGCLVSKEVLGVLREILMTVRAMLVSLWRFGNTSLLTTATRFTAFPQAVFVTASGMEEITGSGEELFTSEALLHRSMRRLIHHMNCLSFCLIPFCCQMSKAAHFSQRVITPLLGNMSSIA